MPEADFEPIQEQDIRDDMEETTEVTLKLILISIKLFLCQLYNFTLTGYTFLRM